MDRTHLESDLEFAGQNKITSTILINECPFSFSWCSNSKCLQLHQMFCILMIFIFMLFLWSGFLVIGCPVKPFTVKSISSLKMSNHKVIMITGDHPLTACQVALDIGMITKNKSLAPASQCLILDKLSPSATPESSTCFWKSRDAKEVVTTSGDPNELIELSQSRALCLTGQTLELYQVSLYTQLIYLIILNWYIW